MKKLFIPLLAVAVLLFTGAPQAEESAFSDAQRTELEKLIGEVLRKKPELIIDALRNYEEQQQKQQQQQQADALEKYREQIERDADDPVMGNPEGDVTLVEFFDYNCGYCKRVFPSVQKLVEEDSKLRLVMKEIPILGEGSVFAARVSLSAMRQGKYSDFHAKLMQVKGKIDENVALAVAKDVGLDMEQVEKDVKSKEVNAIINKNLKLAQDLGINGTPTFIIGGILIPGAVPGEELKTMIDMTRGHD